MGYSPWGGKEPDLGRGGEAVQAGGGNRYKCPQVRKKLMQVVTERHSKQDRLGIRLESYTGNKTETVSTEQSNRVTVPEYLGHF